MTDCKVWSKLQNDGTLNARNEKTHTWRVVVKLSRHNLTLELSSASPSMASPSWIISAVPSRWANFIFPQKSIN
jgi:hypothetical protein